MSDIAVETVQPTETQATTTPTPSAPSVPQTPQAQTRAEIYAQYYGQPTSTSPAPAEGDASAAGGDPVQTPTAQEGETVIPPSAQPTEQTTSVPSAIPTEYLAMVETLKQEILDLKSKVTPPTPTEPTPTPAVEASHVEQFLALLQAGKAVEGVEILEQGIRAKVLQELKEKVTTEASAQAVEQVETKAEINRFIEQVRTANPELVPMEDVISFKTQMALDKAEREGKIKSNADFVREYKAAVTAAVENTKTLYQQIRGAGRQEALTTREQVLASTPVSPTPITQTRANEQPAYAPESPMGYLEKRRQQQWARKGFTN